MLVAGMVLSALLLIILIEWNAHRNADAKLAQLIARLRQGGHPVEFADLDPAKQGKSTAAGSRLLEMIASLDPQLEDLAHDFSGGDGSIAPAFEKVLAENDFRLNEIVAYVEEHEVFFPRPFQSGAMAEGSLGLDAIGSMRMVMRCLAAKQQLAINAANAPAALETTRQMLLFATLYENERLLVDWMVRTALIGMAIDGIERLIPEVAVEEPDRSALDEKLYCLEAAFRLGPVLHGEGAYIRSVVAESYGTNWQDRLARKVNGVWDNWRKLKQLIGSSDSEEYLALWAMDRWAQAADQVGPHGLAAIILAQEEIGKRTVAFPESYSSVAGWAGSLKSSLLIRQLLVNARLGLRVDRYYREQGKLPETLEEVVDEAMPVIPPGLYSGGVPQYEKLADGFYIHDGPLAEQVADDRFEVKYGAKKGAEMIEE
jgi:hypothetical protein